MAYALSLSHGSTATLTSLNRVIALAEAKWRASRSRSTANSVKTEEWLTELKAQVYLDVLKTVVSGVWTH